MKTRLLIIIGISSVAGMFFLFYVGIIGGSCVEGKNFDGTCIEPKTITIPTRTSWDFSEQEKNQILTQLRQGPQNVNGTVKQFLVNEALDDPQLKNLIKDTTYQVDCCIYTLDGNEYHSLLYIGMTFQINEKDMIAIVEYDLQQERVADIEIQEGIRTGGIGLDSDSESLLSTTQFEEIKSNIEETQYNICDIQLEENKIILHLNWVFKGSPQEEKIISKIPPNMDYQTIYHQGYSDYFINAITAQQCDSLEVVKLLKEKYDTVIEGNVTWCMGHKTYPVRYQCDIQVDQYIEFDGERTGNLTVLSDKHPLISGKQDSFFGLNYVADENYYDLVETSIMANYNDFVDSGRPLENKSSNQ
ncbi:hypothetical protein [Candidatus Nitrosopumilus sediminis]|nr:hypothetical protein [Candidatus Nitrosopumilus sediminis]